MTCVECDKPIQSCECPDAPERIRSILDCTALYFTPDQRVILEERAKALEDQKSHTTTGIFELQDALSALRAKLPKELQ